MKISPSLMCMDLTQFKEQILFIDKHANYFHVDIMDGHYVPNLTLSPFFVSQVKKLSTKIIDCHLMVENPQNYVDALLSAGAGMLSLHPETIKGQSFRLINKIKMLGMKFGLVLNPDTKISDIEYCLKYADKVTVMTVDPGFAGQDFIPDMLDKIKGLKVIRGMSSLNFEIEVDGSCNPNTYKQLINAGADVFVVGSSGLFNNANRIEDAWEIMLRNIDNNIDIKNS